jgi:hypothetical protein
MRVDADQRLLRMVIRFQVLREKPLCGQSGWCRTLAGVFRFALSPPARLTARR